jgi:PAS domain S-box-containing protein
MILIKVIPSLALWNELLIDSFLLAIILLPILYFFSFRPLTITIAERKQEKEKAVEIEEKFRKASMTSPDSIIISRLSDGMIISINEGFTKITGYSEKDAVGKTSFELNIWANPGSRNLISKELQEKGRVDSFETIFLKKDMGIVNVLFSASLINLDGVTHILSVTKDISLRKRFEAELGREQFLVNALMDNLPDHIYFKDRESRFIRINKAHAKFFGLMDSTQAVGKTDFDFFTGEHANQAFKEEQSIIRTGQLLSIEEKETHPDSPDSWVSTIKLPLRDKEGNTIGTFGISRDITVRKQKELESQVLFDITQGVTTTENLDELLKLIHQSLGKVVYAENCFVALYDNDTGLFSFPFYVDKIDSTPLPTSMGKSCMDYVFRTFKPLIISPKIFNQLKEQNEVELVGSSSPSWIGIPLRTPAGIIGVLVLQNYEKENVYSESDLKFLISIGSQIAISIERKKAEEELKLKNKLLQIIIAEKDKFFSILSHDLRGPLSAFVGATQILTEEIQVMNKDEIKMITQNMKSSAANIYNLLEDLLEWSCLRQGVMNFIPGKFNLKEKIRNCIDVLSESARRKGIEIVISSPDEMEVFADKHMFDTVVRNLVSNAIKFTPYGGKVSVTADFNNDHSIEIKISDSGIGMTPELKNKLFLINEKTNRKGTEGEPSTGLGLILCKEYIEKNGGKIWVESEEGKGSVFGFTIPEMIHECKSQAY